NVPVVQGTPGQTRPQKPCLLRESLHRVRKPRAFKRGLFSLDRILARMRTQKAKVFDQTVIPAEMVKEHNDIYKLLGIKPAKEYPIKDRPNV
ncbi:hypothetical protein, partial [Duodenibacillus massiliensis]|uniref:hypothetical protein n=2 Tax=Duodenibacillus massiliensis TaxID=1852381 RepID=UPI003AB5A8B7